MYAVRQHPSEPIATVKLPRNTISSSFLFLQSVWFCCFRNLFIRKIKPIPEGTLLDIIFIEQHCCQQSYVLGPRENLFQVAEILNDQMNVMIL